MSQPVNEFEFTKPETWQTWSSLWAHKVCPRCGSLVPTNGADVHVNWHQRTDITGSSVASAIMPYLQAV